MILIIALFRILSTVSEKPATTKKNNQFFKNYYTFMKDFFRTMFSNNEGTSHKRVLGTIGFIALIVFLFTAKETHKSEAVSAVEYITIATVFGTVVEKFANNKPKDI